MNLNTIGLRDATLSSAVVATVRSPAPSLTVPGSFQRAAEIVGDLFALVGIAFCVPFVILAIGMPIALCVRLLLWLGGVG